jgi:pyruvate formate lyase activating enzyme
MCRWIFQELGPDVPLHFSKFYPRYLIKNLPPTPISTLEILRETALQEGIRFVYIGNVPGHPGENTYCPRCQKMVIQRYGIQTQKVDLKEGRCKFCGTPIPGIWA